MVFIKAFGKRQKVFIEGSWQRTRPISLPTELQHATASPLRPKYFAIKSNVHSQ